MKPEALRVLLVDVAGGENSALLAALSSSQCVLEGSVLVRLFDPLADPPDAAGSALVLLAGLAQATAPLQAADHAIRQGLCSSGANYHVLYGTAQDRLAQSLNLIEGACGIGSPRPTDSVSKEGAWTWACDKCSDPQCERHMLTKLLADS